MVPANQLVVIQEKWNKVKNIFTSYTHQLLGHDYGSDLIQIVTRLEQGDSGQLFTSSYPRHCLNTAYLKKYPPTPSHACPFFKEDYTYMICLAEAIAKAHRDLRVGAGPDSYVTMADPLPDLLSVVLHFRFPELIWNGPAPQEDCEDSPPLTPLTSPEPSMEDNAFPTTRYNGDDDLGYPYQVCSF